MLLKAPLRLDLLCRELATMYLRRHSVQGHGQLVCQGGGGAVGREVVRRLIFRNGRGETENL